MARRWLVQNQGLGTDYRSDTQVDVITVKMVWKCFLFSHLAPHLSAEVRGGQGGGEGDESPTGGRRSAQVGDEGRGPAATERIPQAAQRGVLRRGTRV